MYLYVNLSGEAAEELEHCELDLIDHEQGIEYILETLRTPLMVKGVYLKRKFLDDFEHLSRRNGESIPAFTNRYHRCERSLQSVGVQVSNMYDDEAAGSRLMDRMRLGAEAQRMILIATGNSLRYRDIKEAAETQFPEHRATPAVVYNRDFEDTPKEPRDRGRDRPDGPPRGQWKAKDGKGKGKDRGKSSGKGSSSTFVRSSYITEIPEGGQSEDEHAPAEEDELGGDETPQEAADADPTEQEADQASDAAEDFSDLDLAAHCLTVTARRLSNMRLGRKFSGGGKSISQRKAESHCAVCGQKGHWRGDKECPQSASSSSEVKPKTGKDDSKTKGAGKKVLSVLHPDGHNRSVNFNLDTNNDKETPYGTYFTYMVTSPAITPSRTLGDGLHQVFGANLETYEHHLIMDTACQKTCCSNTWLDRWTQHVKQYHFRPKLTPSREPFEFGHGPLQYSTHHAFLPCGFTSDESSFCLLGTSVLTTSNDIPLLGSNTLLKDRLQAVLDLPNQLAFLSELQCTIPICLLNGHLALDIARFTTSSSRSKVWKQLSESIDAGSADAEFVFLAAADSRFTDPSSTTCDAPTTTSLASAMAPCGAYAAVRGVPPPARDEPGGAPSNSPSKLASSPGPVVDGREGEALLESHGSVPAREDHSLRQPTWQVQPMRGLQHEMEVGRQRSKVGGTAGKRLAAAAAAFTVFMHGGDLRGQALHPCAPDGPHTSFEILHTGSREQGPVGNPIQIHGIEAQDQEGSGGRAFGDCLGRQLRVGQGGQLGPSVTMSSTSTTAPMPMSSRMPTSGTMPSSGTTPSTKKGSTAWLLGHLRNSRKTYEREIHAYQSLTTHSQWKRGGCQADVLEIFAGKARISSLAHYFGLSAVQPFDLEYDINLMTKEGIDLLWNALNVCKPLLVVVEWPCKEWSLFNRNMNYSWRLDELEARREEQRPLVYTGRSSVRTPNRTRQALPGREPFEIPPVERARSSQAPRPSGQHRDCLRRRSLRQREQRWLPCPKATSLDHEQRMHCRSTAAQAHSRTEDVHQEDRRLRHYSLRSIQ